MDDLNGDITIRIPGSKSITHRALITGALARGQSTLSGFLLCEDTLHTMNCIRMLTQEVTVEDNRITLHGKGGKFPSIKGIEYIYLGDSGTSLRLLLSVIALIRGKFIITGSKRMRERPIGELVSALNQMGVDARCIAVPDFPPVFMNSRGIKGGRISIKGRHSSQFISSILISSPYAEKDVEIELQNEPVSRPYIDITIDVMNQFGVSVIRDGYRYFKVKSGIRYRTCNFQVEGDVSSASYFWGISAITGLKIITENIFPFKTRQGDIRFLDVLENMGCKVKRASCGAMVQGNELKGVEVDMRDMPDMVPTLSALSLFAEGRTVIRNIPHLVHKESNRVECLAMNIKNIGGRVELINDGIIVYGGKKLRPGVIDPQNDHRIAMAFAIASFIVPGINIVNKDCVKKSFPDFWRLWQKINQFKKPC